MDTYKGKGALVFSWSTPVRGREMKALEVLGSSVEYFERLRTDGRVDDCRVYTSAAANEGMLVVDGDFESLNSLYLDEDVHRIIAKSNLVGDDFRVRLMAGGHPEDAKHPAMLFAQMLGELDLA
ncbi:MAG: hypothetical protein ABWZ15_06595 [Acidimicrobiia bacterium]